MNSDNLLWQSKTSGKKSIIVLLVNLALLLGSLLAMIIGSQKAPESESLTIVTMAGMVFSILLFVAVIIVMRRTDLKWEVSSLIFKATENGMYFTGLGNMDSFFYAEWAEIEWYSIIQGKNGKATVTVQLDGIADAGVLGKIDHMKMVGIKGAEELCKIFEKFNVKNMDISKN